MATLGFIFLIILGIVLAIFCIGFAFYAHLAYAMSGKIPEVIGILAISLLFGFFSYLCWHEIYLHTSITVNLSSP